MVSILLWSFLAANYNNGAHFEFFHLCVYGYGYSISRLLRSIISVSGTEMNTVLLFI